MNNSFMELQFILLFTVLCGLFLIFRVRAKKLEKKPLKRISILRSIIFLNQGQIQLRQNSLRQYDFQKFNLDDVLMVQYEIDVTA